MNEALAWRYATQKYDPAKQLDETDLNEILHAINSAPTAFGLQPFKLIHVKNKEIRNALKAVSYNQSQITDASDLFVFVVNKQVDKEHIEDYMNRISEVRAVEKSLLTGFQQNIFNSLTRFTEKELIDWSARQAYIGLGFGLVRAAQLGIDSTPMEGFQNEEYNKLLNLENEHSILVLALGYRAADDPAQHKPKVRKKIEHIVTIK